MALPLVSNAERVADGYTIGKPWSGEAGVREKTRDIMQRQAANASRGRRPYRIHQRPDFDVVEYVGGDFPLVTPQDAGAAAAGGPTAQTVSTTFLGATLADCQAYPPDSMGAVGPAQFIVAVNGRIRSFNKNTGVADGVINTDTDVFFTPAMTPPVNDNFTSDPRIRYDRLSQRWFIIMIDVPGQTGALPNRVMIAVSDGPIITPGSIWTFFQFQHDQPSGGGDTGKFADYPTLGVDANALYIGVNIFGQRGNSTSFSDTAAFVVRKSSILGAGPIVVTAFRGLIPHGNSGGPYTPQGVDNYDPNATEGYIIGVNSRFYNQLNLRRISNPGGTPSISGNLAISSAGNGNTINVPHLGNTGGAAGNLDGLDYRLMAAHYRNGRLWTTANLAVDNTGSPSGTDTRMGVRWYEIDGIPTGQTPGIVQSGTVFEPSASNTTTERNYWMGTAMISGQGHVAMGFSVAGANEYVNAGTVGRLKNDPLGTMRTPVLYTTSSSAYNPRDSNNQPINRWGDYSYTCLDPDDDMTMWTIQEWCSSPNYFGVQIAKLLAPAPATPFSCSPATLAQGDANVNVTLVGAGDGDTGFFDPGAGFSNRIAAAISGSGVTVNSIAYNNPTNLTLNLSASGVAATGARTVTVTNPDGQSASSDGGILTITGVTPTNHPPVLAVISQKAVNELQLLMFTNSASDPDGNDFTFSLDAGVPSNATINTTSGVFSWTPDEAQGPATNSISVIVTDNGSPSLSATQTFMVVVSEVNAAPLLSAIPNQSVTEGFLLTFTNAASDDDIPSNSLAFSLAADAPSNATISASSGVFSWMPSEAQGPGTNLISVIVTDDGSPSLSTTQTFTVIVLETNAAPTLAAIADQVVHAGTLIQFTNIAADSDLPANTLTFSLAAGAPPAASVDATNGIFVWPTSDADVDTTNSITVTVTDDGSPSLSASRTFTAAVLARPVIQFIELSNAFVTLNWNSISGQTYRVQTKLDINDTNWSNLLPEITATGPTASRTTLSISPSQEFYRVFVLP